MKSIDKLLNLFLFLYYVIIKKKEKKRIYVLTKFKKINENKMKIQSKSFRKKQKKESNYFVIFLIAFLNEF